MTTDAVVAPEFDPKKHVIENGVGFRKDGRPKKKPGRKRRDPDAEIAALKTRLAELEKPKELNPIAKAAAEELPRLRPPSPEGDPSVMPEPYRGRVKALQQCYFGGLHDPGEVFYVEVEALWSDDPYVPVTESGELHPFAKRASHRLRPRSGDALAAQAQIPRPADQY